MVSHLLEMGLRFCDTVEWPVRHAAEEHVFQNVHWGLELVLKAYLHAQGWTDERCISEVRHDIALALAACEREALLGVDDASRALVEALSPYSKRRGVAEFMATGGGGYTSEQALGAARNICEAVCRALGKGPQGERLPLRPSL